MAKRPQARPLGRQNRVTHCGQPETASESLK
jgi:hypothetical protein